MAGVPMQQRLGFGQRRKVIRRDQALHGDRAQVGDDQIGHGLQRLDCGRLETYSEPSVAGEQAEEDQFGRGAQRASFIEGEQRVEVAAVSLQDDEFAADRVDAGLPAGAECRERSLVTTLFGGSLQRTRGVAERPLRAEIARRGHATESTSRRSATHSLTVRCAPPAPASEPNAIAICVSPGRRLTPPLRATDADR